MTLRDLLTTYTTNVARSRNAYAADQAVASGFCATCRRNKRDGGKRQCWPCRHPLETRKSA